MKDNILRNFLIFLFFSFIIAFVITEIYLKPIIEDTIYKINFLIKGIEKTDYIEIYVYSGNLVYPYLIDSEGMHRLWTKGFEGCEECQK